VLIRKTIKTSKQKEIVDITDEISDFVKTKKVLDGLAVIFTRHTTCAVMVTETSKDLESDIMRFLSLGQQLGPYSHGGNDPAHAPSHFFSSIIGQSTSIPFEKGKLLLGTWQRIVLLELDGPREREIIIQTV
jgi:secondary thiamine-phosphate synthase enzyme